MSHMGLTALSLGRDRCLPCFPFHLFTLMAATSCHAPIREPFFHLRFTPYCLVSSTTTDHFLTGIFDFIGDEAGFWDAGACSMLLGTRKYPVTWEATVLPKDFEIILLGGLVIELRQLWVGNGVYEEYD